MNNKNSIEVVEEFDTSLFEGIESPNEIKCSQTQQIKDSMNYESLDGYYPKFKMLASLEPQVLQSGCNYSVLHLLNSMTEYDELQNGMGIIKFKDRGYTLVNMSEYICSKNLYQEKDKLTGEKKIDSEGNFIEFPKAISRQSLQNEICKLAYHGYIELCAKVKNDNKNYEVVTMDITKTKNTKNETIYKLANNQRFTTVDEIYVNYYNERAVKIDSNTYRYLSKVLRPDALKVYLYMLDKNRYFKKTQKVWKINALTIFKDVFGAKEQYSQYDVKKIYEIISGLSVLDIVNKDTEVSNSTGKWTGIYIIKNVKEPKVEGLQKIDNKLANRGRRKGA